ncbi:MAG TPA: ATPase [Flavobacterium sp.]|nr:ATPase [Flavobacterium sp.]
MQQQKVVLMGGPGTGKTSLLEKLKQEGYSCYPEISREIIREAQKRGVAQLFLKQPLLFSKLLLAGRTKQFEQAQQENARIVFLDRGLPDVLAYMNFTGNNYPYFFETACKKYIYSKIFILPIWEEIYKTDAERYETYEQAVLIEQHLMHTYKKFGYKPIEIPKDTLEKRVQFIKKHIDL